MALVDLTPSVTLNGGQVDITVYEDLGDTGTVDNQETVTDVQDGTVYELSTLDGGAGNSYYVDIDLSTPDVTNSPEVFSVDLSVQTTFVGSSAAQASSTGTISSASASGQQGTREEIEAFETTGSSTWNAPDGVAEADALLVAGGGGAGQNNNGDGGGGAGGVIFETVSVNGGESYTITVGAGGAPGEPGENGEDTTAFGLTAIGGGGGANQNGDNAQDGGSGGGGDGAGGDGNPGNPGGTGLQPGSEDGGFGNDGGTGWFESNEDGGGGGGGAAEAGGDASTNTGGDGGAGKDFSAEFGTSYGENGYFGGGGGGNSFDGSPASGGIGGGGDGGNGSNGPDDGQDGLANTGGGGGAGENGGSGGSGVVLLKYTVQEKAQASASGAATGFASGSADGLADASSRVGLPASATTDLPDEDQPVLGNGVEDEVEVDRESAVTDYGDIRYQIRETGEDSWTSSATGFSEFLGNFDTLVFEYVGREDGEEYEVRGRTETEHRIGAWTDPVSIVTKFPGVRDLTVADVTDNAITIEWVDDADNEDGTIVERRSIVNGTPTAWEVVDTLDPTSGQGDTVSYTSTGVRPETEYQFRVTAFTSFTSATSNTASATGLGEFSQTVSSSGWEFAVKDPDTGRLRKADVLDSPTYSPGPDTLPRLTIPVPKSDYWIDERLDDDPEVRVWKDGERLPIDTLRDVEVEESRAILECVGGTELEGRAEVEYDTEERYLAAQGIITTYTSYEADAPEPDFGTVQDSVLQSGSGEDGLNSIVSSGEVIDTVPLAFKNGGIETLQSAYTAEGEEEAGSSNTIVYDHPWASGGQYLYQFGDSISSREYNFNLEYTIPEGNVEAGFQLWFRDLDFGEYGGGTSWIASGFELYVNNDLVESTADTFSFGPVESTNNKYTFPEFVENGDGTDVTSEAKTDDSTFSAFGSSVSSGDTLFIDFDGDYVGIDFDVTSNGSGYTVEWEYLAEEVDSNGDTITNEWRPIPNVSDTTNGLKESGEVSWSSEDILEDTQDGGERVIHDDANTRARVTSTSSPESATVDRVSVESGPPLYFNATNYSGGDLSGNVEVRFESISQEANGFIIDTVSLVDDRYGHVLDEQTNSGDGGYYPTPQEQPRQIDVNFETASSALTIIAGKAESDTLPIPPKEIALSADEGSTYDTATDTDTITTEYDDAKSSLKARVTLGGSGTRDTATPTEGFEPQRLEALTVSADLRQQLLLLNYTADDSVAEILSDIANGADLTWSYNLQNGTPTVSFVTKGQRVSDVTPDLTALSQRKTGQTYDKVTVKSSNQPVSSERYTADSTYQPLANGNILSGSETVYDPDTGDRFERGTDYEIRYTAGEVRITDGSAMTSGEVYYVDYQYKVTGSFSRVGSPERELIETVPDVTSTDLAEQVAFDLLGDLDTPRYAADVRVTDFPATYNPVEAIPAEEVGFPPRVGELEVSGDPEVTAEAVEIQFGSRPTEQEAIRRLREQVSKTVERS